MHHLLAQHKLDTKDIDSIVFIEEGKAYTKSSAALKISTYLRWPWKGACVLVVIPRRVRDWVTT
jgi:predicted DCC family thiol-disulfide oxidoreductase YuxK